MGRAHHDGQELEHLPERRLGEEHSRARGAAPERNSRLPNLGSEKCNSTCDSTSTHESSPPAPLSLSPRFITRAAPHCRRHMPRSPTTTKDGFQCLVVRATLDDLLCPFPSCTCWPPRPLRPGSSRCLITNLAAMPTKRTSRRRAEH